MRSAVPFSALVLALALCAVVATASKNSSPVLVVPTESGLVQGFVQNDLARAFLGIPFADPPLGAKRFGVATPAAPWTGVYNATAFPKPCIQSSTVGVEDCLYLNVFTPKNAKAGDKLPVMVWIHGGRYWAGQTDQYQGQWLAGNGNVVLVTIQYRLNTLGFFATPELVDAGSINVGFQDQILAVEWVRNNIANFGGDRKEITLFGESAGGNAAMLHTMVHKYTNPGAYLEYAENVILHSTWQWVMPTLAQQLSASIKFAASKGCNQTASADMLACMRALPVKNVTSGYVNYFQPSVDGIFLTDQPYNLVKRGEYNTDVNVIIGYTADEGNYLALSRNSYKPPSANLTEADYIRVVKTNSLRFWLTDEQIDNVFGWYAAHTAAVGYWYGEAQLLGDFYVNCGQPGRALLRQARPDLRLPVELHEPQLPRQFLQAAHGNELPYVFNATVYTPYAFAPSDYALASRMIAAWSRIADKGKPDSSEWPKYKKNRPTDADLNPPTRTVPFLQSNFCANWEPIFSTNSVVQP
ncbi:carboxylesterase superfamily protein [Acanthamoeba castellanii str. Neff]|uniref:Carboxylic ester hydrolase n=1 Tax=Acanthamoeba castellanii (strain ATCC 30010 / Neff) TaxID=1257118 RepID=L8H9L6_ACACF|nr:carboxylesterase superfamily protein [Acanthamoeba castellanii str. Neff]ELR21428.1 carboxylesterase superfamily protein [Acanthamoeba castellanii str. Neff]